MKRKYTRYPEELKAHALRLAAESGVSAASRETGVETQRILYWARKRGVVLRRKRYQSYSSGVRERALVLAKQYGPAAAARKMGLTSGSSIYDWADAQGINLRDPKRTLYSNELKEKAVARAAEVGVGPATREFGIKSQASIRGWAQQRGVRLPRLLKGTRDRTRYSKKFKENAVRLAERVGSREAARILGIQWRSTIDKWVRQAGKKARSTRKRTWDEEKIQKAVDLTEKYGVSGAMRRLGLKTRSQLQKWRKDRGYGPLPGGRRLKYSPRYRFYAITVAKKLGEKKATEFFALDIGTLRRWIKKEESDRALAKKWPSPSRGVYTWPYDYRVLVVQEASAQGLDEAGVEEKFGVPAKHYLKWKERMLRGKSERVKVKVNYLE